MLRRPFPLTAHNAVNISTTIIIYKLIFRHLMHFLLFRKVLFFDSNSKLLKLKLIFCENKTPYFL